MFLGIPVCSPGRNVAMERVAMADLALLKDISCEEAKVYVRLIVLFHRF